jgi:hypothetical protein
MQKKVTNSYGCGMVSTICCCVNLTYRQAPGVSDKTREAKTWVLDHGRSVGGEEKQNGGMSHVSCTEEGLRRDTKTRGLGL